VAVDDAASSLGPLTIAERNAPHVYARDITSASGDCVCKAELGDSLHLEAAPGVPVPESAREVAKGAEPQRYVLAVAYQPDRDPRIQKGQDGGRDFFSEEELEKAAFSFLLSGNPQIGIGHADGSAGAARVVESYIYRNEQPWDIGNGIVVTKGTWLIGAILDPKSWEMALDGRLTGMSPQGTARRRRVRAA
jgi:hypothetical protein